MTLALQPMVIILNALESLNLCESEARRMVTDTIDIYGDYRVDDGLKDEAEQLRYKLLALSVYYPQYFGYDPELMSNINDELYAQADEAENNKQLNGLPFDEQVEIQTRKAVAMFEELQWIPSVIEVYYLDKLSYFETETDDEGYCDPDYYDNTLRTYCGLKAAERIMKQESAELRKVIDDNPLPVFKGSR